MSVSALILRSYLAPRSVMRFHLDRGIREERSLGFLALACVLIFIGQWPRLARSAHLDPDIPLDARIVGALLAVVFVLPLICYGVALLSQLLARLGRRPVTGGAARLALFWALLAVSPLMLLHGALAGLAGPGGITALAGVLVLCAFVIIWGAGLREAALEPPATTA